MDYDKLVEFAAGKPAMEIYYDNNINDYPMYFGTEDIFDPSSPDLMLRGMDVAFREKREAFVDFDGALRRGCVVFENGDWRKSKKVFFKQPSEIPLAFWTARHNLEKG